MLPVYQGVEVVIDDLRFPGGTKQRYLGYLFDQADEVVYASPCQGGAQVALAICASQRLNRRAVIFCAARKKRHPRTKQAAALGAVVYEIRPGYLNVIQARAAEYAQQHGSLLAPFGLDIPEASDAIVDAACSYSIEPPDEVWCAAGSGTLSRGLQRAWPSSKHYAVQVGHHLTSIEAGSATIVTCPYRFDQSAHHQPPFLADWHYEAKAWEMLLAGSNRVDSNRGRVLFWSVMGPPRSI